MGRDSTGRRRGAGEAALSRQLSGSETEAALPVPLVSRFCSSAYK